MIELTKLDETKILVNEDHIQTVEETPDTVVTFENGKKLIVKEGRMNILELVKDFRYGDPEKSR